MDEQNHSTNAVDHGKDKPDKTLTVVIRTPGNIPATFEFRGHDRVDKATREAVAYFIGRNELVAGDYGMALVRGGEGVELNDAGRLEDYDVVDGDELHLINRAPQVDG